MEDWKGENLIRVRAVEDGVKQETEREKERREKKERAEAERKRIKNRRARVQRLHEKGVPPPQIAKQLGEMDTLIYNDLKAIAGIKRR